MIEQAVECASFKLDFLSVLKYSKESQVSLLVSSR